MNYDFFKCNFLPKKELWEKVEQFREKFCSDYAYPLNIEFLVEEKLGLDIEPISGLRELDIDAFLKSDRSGIVVDESRYMDERNDNRLRFSLAHEIGHFVLHGYIHDNFNIQIPKDYYNFITNANNEDYGKFEWQANEFAGRLLVPRYMLIDEIKKILERIAENDRSLLTYYKKDPFSVLENASSLCKSFGVSDNVITIRLQREFDEHFLITEL